MIMKGLTVSIMLGAFAWQTVQASSISTRVRVLETKVTQFERQANQERALQKTQVEQIQKNATAIDTLTVRLDKVQNEIEQNGSNKAGKGRTHYLTDGRFTDSRYSFP